MSRARTIANYGDGLAASEITSGTLAVARGGTGITATGADGQVLTSTGSAWQSEAAAAGGSPISTYTADNTKGGSGAAIKIGDCGVTSDLPAGGTDGAFEAGKSYVLRLINIKWGAANNFGFQIYVETSALITTDTYDVCIYGHQTDGTSQNTIDSFRAEDQSVGSMVAGTDISFPGTGYTTQGVVWFHEPHSSVEKKWFGETCYYNEADNICRSSFVTGNPTGHAITGAHFYLNSVGNHAVTGKLALYEI